MRIIMTGGGTGGHIYPGIAIADEIVKRNPEAKILFVGTEKGLEKSIVPEQGYEIRYVTASGLNRKSLLKNFKVLGELRKGISEGKAIIREFKPDMVIGTGGYVCVPVVLAARKSGAKVFLHEQNAFPGIANKYLARYAEKVFLGFEEGSVHFRDKKKLVFSGNPVRKEFYDADKKASRAELGIEDGSFVILSFGGSRGAEKINEVMSEVAEALSGSDTVSVIFVTGKVYYDKILAKLPEAENIRILPYMEHSHVYLSACDCVVSRAGAIAVSEIGVSGKPAVLIPSPNVTGNHQFFNGKALADKGSALLIEEKDFDGESLVRAIIRIRDGEVEGGAKDAEFPKRAVEIICDNIGIGASK